MRVNQFARHPVDNNEFDFIDEPPLPCGSDNLFRVQYPGTQTLDKHGELHAAETSSNTEFDSRTDAAAFRDFCDAVRRALNWYTDKPSPFIQVFSNYRHAVNWMRQWARDHPGNDDKVTLLTIDHNRLENPYYWTKEVSTQVNVTGPGGPYDDQYLIEHYIPVTAINDERCMQCAISREEPVIPEGCSHGNHPNTLAAHFNQASFANG